MAWINEFHYDDANGDQGEFVEVAAAAGTDLTGWTIVLYNGSPTLRSAYSTIDLSGVIPNQQNGIGTLTFPAPGIQNGAPDGIALVNANKQVVEFISYEGSFTATDGPAAGMTSTNVGVSEPGNVEGSSIARTGTGSKASDFAWVVDGNDTPGTVNNAQTFTGGEPTLSIGDISVVEGAGGTSAVFTITLSAAAQGSVTVDFMTRDGSATAGSDYALTQGTLTFAPGETSKTIEIPVIDDAIIEDPETFVLVLSNAAGATIADPAGQATITSDDQPDTSPGTLSIGDVGVEEGDGVTTPMSFVITRENGSDGQVTVDYSVTFGDASADDFAAGTPLNGTVTFAAGQTSAEILIEVAGDAAAEQNEAFTVTLANATGGASLGDASGRGIIINDDIPPVNTGVFINEFHYDDASTDSGEAVEVAAAAGTDLAGWTLVLYSTDSRTSVVSPYRTVQLSGVVQDQDDGYGTISVPAVGLQNGAEDGIALVDPFGRVVQFLSYEGAITADTGPAKGMTSQDIGVAEDGGTLDGTSLQLIGEGASYADFSWAPGQASTFGTVNTGQNFLGGEVTGRVRIEDSSVVEGNDGTRQLVFTVRRAGGLNQTASVDYAVGLNGTANAADLPAGQALAGTVSFGVGQASVQIAIGIAGDTTAERSETLSISLSNPVGNIEIVDADARGTIVNDDALTLRTFEIQGAGHRSEFEGQPVITGGIVTALASNGFYLQDPAGDGDARTSDALFVFTRAAPTVAVGDAVEVAGNVSEFGSGDNLPITQVTASGITVQSGGNALPAAVLIGTGGILPPTETIDDDQFGTFDPENDGIDFYESLEGMRVTVDAPIAIENSGSGSVQVVASLGEGATGLNAQNGITISDGDFNPERIRLFSKEGLLPGVDGGFTQGDQLSDATGVVSYYRGGYEIILTEAVNVVEDAPAPAPETTSLVGDRNHLTVASYNVLNLNPADGAAKYDLLANDIVYDLKAPDIIGLQEIQDANGAQSGGDLSGLVTAQLLIDRINAISDIDYVYVEIAPSSENSTGGERAGNIRNGFLYRADRVTLVEGSVQLVEGPAFEGTRRPLYAEFSFNGDTIGLLNMHSSARIGSDPLFGANQPPVNADEGRRIAQSEAALNFIQSLGTAPNFHFGVLGDFNAFYFEQSVELFEESGIFTNLHRLLPEEDRYSYEFGGNAQAIDHLLVSGGLMGGAQFDAVHINAVQPFGLPTASDHDPIVARFFIEAPNEAPADLAIDDAAVEENAPAGALVGTFSATDIDGDTLSYQLVDDADGLFDLDAVTGALTTTKPLNFEGQSSYVIEAQAVDPDGLKVTKTFTISVLDANDAPSATSDAVAVDEDATSGNLWTQLIANDTDEDAGAQLSIQSVNTSATLGRVEFDAATQTLRYVADNDAFDQLPAGQSAVDRFTYTVIDQNGAISVATVEVTVTGIADTETRFGGNGKDVIRTGGGEDFLYGGNGSDSLFGGDGHDLLAGGRGQDELSGGLGRDSFLFERGGGTDTILDFDLGRDSIALGEGIEVKDHKIGDFNGDGVKDLSVAFSNGGGTAILLGVTDFEMVNFVGGGSAGFEELGYHQNLPVF